MPALWGGYLRSGLEQLAQKYELIGDVRGTGLFFGVELVQDRDSKWPAPEAAKKLVNVMKDKGILMSRIGMHDNILKMRPPICFSSENADLLLTALDETFKQL